MAKKQTDEAVEAEVTTEAPAKVKEPINPQVPAEYKSESGRYKPGYDAKHASNVAARILAGEDEQEALRELGSDNLREKALKQVQTAQAKYATQGEAGYVLIDGDEYEARKVRGGSVRVDGPDGWEVHESGPVFESFESQKDRDKGKAEAEAAGQAAE